jgi:hypothetical protein
MNIGFGRRLGRENGHPEQDGDREKMAAPIMAPRGPKVVDFLVMAMRLTASNEPPG